MKARPAEPVPSDLTPEELFQIENFFARPSLDAAAVRRWDTWVADGRTAKREFLRLPDLDGLVDIETLETRLGWGAKVHFAGKREHVAHGNPIRPDYSGGVDWFFWQTRDAAIAYCANKIWVSALGTRGYSDRKRKYWERFAGEMQAFCERVGIDVTVPPPASVKCVVITDARVRELKAGAPPAPAPPPAALTPEELAEIEAYAVHGDAYGPVGDAARDRWEDWIAEAAIGETFSVPLRGRRDRAIVEIVQTRLGWMVRYDCQYPDKGCCGGAGLMPLRDTVGRYLWADREAALQAGAHSAWSSAVHTTPAQTAEARARIGERIRGHFLALGIDATVEPALDRRRRLISKERIEELQAAAASAAPPVAPAEATADDPPGVDIPVRRLLQRAGVIQPMSPLAMKRRQLKAQRQTAAAAAKAAVPEPASPRLELTFDMGPFKEAHMLDRCDPGPDGYVVACPPFHAHDETHVDPVDKFLGQVVGIEAARALLFRRRDPDIMDGCEVGGRYVLMRFWDDETGEVWSTPVKGDGDGAVLQAIRETTALYRGHRPAPA